MMHKKTRRDIQKRIKVYWKKNVYWDEVKNFGTKFESYKIKVFWDGGGRFNFACSRNP